MPMSLDRLNHLLQNQNLQLQRWERPFVLVLSLLLLYPEYWLARQREIAEAEAAGEPVLTGLTRDGTFLIENAVTNLGWSRSRAREKAIAVLREVGRAPVDEPVT